MTYPRQSHVVQELGRTVLPLLLWSSVQVSGQTLPASEVAAAPKAKAEAPKETAPVVKQIGEASWYGHAHDGKRTASGELFNAKKMTAAHRTLPLGTKAVVTNLETGKSAVVRVNDRGPYVKGRKIDLSRAAALEIGMYKKGVAKVKIEASPEANRKGAALGARHGPQ